MILTLVQHYLQENIGGLHDQPQAWPAAARTWCCWPADAAAGWPARPLLPCLAPRVTRVFESLGTSGSRRAFLLASNRQQVAPHSAARYSAVG